MNRWLRALVLTLSALVFLLLLLSMGLRQGIDAALYPPKTERIAIHLVDHGYHAGLILPRERLAGVAKETGLTRLSAALAVFDRFSHVEIGWGEENFYRYVPDASVATLPHVVKALVNPFNRSVLHFVGLDGDPAKAFPASSAVGFQLGPEGFLRLAAAIDAEFRPLPSGDVAPLGPGLYGPSAFFGAVSRYHLLNTCNHWVGRMLSIAGLPYSPVEATFSFSLRHHLMRHTPRE